MCVCVSLFCVFFLIVPHIFLLHIPAISLVEIGNGLRKYHYHNEMRANGARLSVFFFFSLLVVWWVSKRGSLATMTTILMQNHLFFLLCIITSVLTVHALLPERTSFCPPPNRTRHSKLSYKTSIYYKNNN